MESRGTTSLFGHLRKKDDYTNDFFFCFLKRERIQKESLAVFQWCNRSFYQKHIFHNCLDLFYPLWARPAGALRCRQAKALSPSLRQPLHSLLLKLYALALCASATTAPLKLAPSY